MLVIFMIGVYIVPVLASVFTSLILGKMGKLTLDQSVALGFCLYFIIGLLFGLATLANYESHWFLELCSFIGVILLWPLCIMYMEFGQPDGGERLRWSVFIFGFVLTQMIAIFMIIKRSRLAADEELEISD